MHGSLRINRGVQGFTIAAALIAGCASLALAEGNRRVGTNFVAKRSAAPPETNANDRVDELLNCLLGADVAVSNQHLNAKANASGTFAGKLSVLGFDQGIILSSGNIGTLDGPNTGDATSTDNNDLGDPDLDALIPGYETFDAAVLEFDFECSSAQEISFQYVFGSEEYNEYVDSPFNDVFGFFLNGVNIAGAPAGCSDAGLPVSINNVNCGNPHVGQGPNCDCFRNNDLDDGGGLINTEMDDPGLLRHRHHPARLEPHQDRDRRRRRSHPRLERDDSLPELHLRRSAGGRLLLLEPRPLRDADL